MSYQSQGSSLCYQEQRIFRLRRSLLFFLGDDMASETRSAAHAKIACRVSRHRALARVFRCPY